MTDTVTENAATNGTGPSESEADDAAPMDRLKQAAQTLLSAATQKAVSAAVEKVDGLTDRLGDVAENGGVGLSSALGGGAAALQGGSPIGGALKAGASALKDKVTGALGFGGGDEDEDAEGSGSGSGGGGGTAGARGKFKFMNIFEVQDVGVPIRVAYDQWTQFADFPSFMKKVETADQESDEKINWKAQVFWSHRSWETTIVEQVPDSHIIWTSTGAKGHADGAVTFGELAPNMTRIILILEYYPQGFFEKTGNIWRAVGRRARLEFKHFCRHVMMDTLINREELEGWRGEIRDSEVVKTHEEAMEEEQAEIEGDGSEEDDDDLADDEYEEAEEDEYADDELEDAEEAEDEGGEDAEDELDADEDEAEDADDELDADEADEADEAEDEYAEAEDEYAEDEYAEDEYADDEVEDEEPDEADDELDDSAEPEPEPEPEPERPRRRAGRRKAVSAT